MPATLERQAPPTPDHRPSDDEMQRIVFGPEPEDGPDEIIYHDPNRGTLRSSRAEREKAARIWQEEGQIPHPDNAAVSLQRTEDMLRFRLQQMDPSEIVHAAPDVVAVTHARVHSLEPAPTEPATPDWVGAETGQYDRVPNQANDANENDGYTGSHRAPENTETPRRTRRMRFPLHKLIRHAYRPRHASK
jgi:hypothetical protein